MDSADLRVFRGVPAGQAIDVGILFVEEQALEGGGAVGEGEVIASAGQDAFAVEGVVGKDDGLAVEPDRGHAIAIDRGGEDADVFCIDHAEGVGVIAGDFLDAMAGGDADGKFGDSAGGAAEMEVEAGGWCRGDRGGSGRCAAAWRGGGGGGMDGVEVVELAGDVGVEFLGVGLEGAQELLHGQALGADGAALDVADGFHRWTGRQRELLLRPFAGEAELVNGLGEAVHGGLHFLGPVFFLGEGASPWRLSCSWRSVTEGAEKYQTKT